MADWTALVIDKNDVLAWAMRGDTAHGPVLSELSDMDIAGLTPPIIVSGHPAAPGLDVPAALPLIATQIAPQTYALPTLTQARPNARIGDATAQLNGLDAREPDFDGVACLVGARTTHWVRISAREVVSLQSSLTGRLIAGFGRASIGDGFSDALSHSLSRPTGLASDLAVADLGDDSARITGHLVGADLGAARAYWLGQAVVVIGDGPLAKAYVQALDSQGSAPSHLGGDVMSLVGLSVAYTAVAG